MTDKRQQLPFDNFDADSFVGGVLGRTSGSACERAAAQLGDLMANRLNGLDRQLVQAHLEHCAGCRELAVTVGWLTPLLPEMAEIDPGPDFVGGVLQRTSAVRPPVAAELDPTGLAGWMDRLGRWWERQILRPQFAVQVAYVATVALVLAVYAPGSPLRSVPHQALQVMTAGPASAPIIGPAVIQASGWVDSQGALAVDEGRSLVRNRWQRFSDSLAQRADRSTASRTELSGHWRNFTTQARAREVGGASYELLAVLRTGQVAWQQWWHEENLSSGS